MKLKPKAKLATPLSWGWSGLALALFILVFGTSLALHLLTLPARSVSVSLTVPEQPFSVSTNAASTPITERSLTRSVETPGLLIPLGQMGQSIVQGEFGLLIDEIERTQAAPNTASLLLAVHVHLTNFQGSYYKTRSLAGSTFSLKPTSNPGSASSSISSLGISSRLSRQPALDVAGKTNMQFGDVASGWVTFELPDLSKFASAGEAWGLEFQFTPANTSVPIRVRVASRSN